MKTLNFFKLLLIATLVVGHVQAARLTDEDKADVKKQLDELLSETKAKDGTIEMAKFNMTAFQSLEDFHVDRKITREELLKFKEELEGVRVKTAAKDREKQIRTLFDKYLLDVDKTKKDLIKLGGICNHWDCEEGLQCAPVPTRVESNAKLKSGDQACSKDSECHSGECVASDKDKKVCAFTYRCYQPQPEGKSCLENPVCAKGSCSEVFFSDANIGACASNGNSCKTNLDCCSDSCVKGTCQENYKCQDCIKSGKLSRGQKCCEDQSIEENGKCVPLVVPLNPFVKFFEKALDIVFPKAMAIEDDFVERDDSGRVNSPSRTQTAPSADQQYRDRAKQKQFYQGQGSKESQPGVAGQASMDRATIGVGSGSNFETCEINLINDYAKRLTEGRMPGGEQISMLEVELSLLGFEYIAGGNNQIEDYWKGGDGNKSIHQRINTIAKKRTERRVAFYGDLKWFEPKITCLCLEKTGWKQMTDDQRLYYEKDCRLGLAIPPLQGGTPEDIQRFRDERDDKTAQLAKSPEEWAAHIAELKKSTENNEIEEGDDALGLKALALLEAWAATNATIEEMNLVLTNLAMTDLSVVHDWMTSEAGWNRDNATMHKKQKLYDWEIANKAGPSNPMIAVALLSAGIIAIIGGFAFASTVSAWVSIAVISSAAASAGAGIWMISSLRGAWYSSAPYVQDNPNGSYKCGKSTTCFKFQRVVYQPYNTVCNKNISANACIKHFVVADEGSNNKLMLVDPWIPQGIEKGDLIKDTRDLAVLLDQGWTRAHGAMKANAPGTMSIFGSQIPVRQNEAFFSKTIVTNKVLAEYAPKLNGTTENYMLAPAIKEKIINGAAEFMKEQGWAASDTEARKFGNYVYKNHFLWPKTAYADVLAYPQPGFISYVGLIANGLATNMEFSTGLAGGFRQLQQSYRGELERRRSDFEAIGNRVGIDGNETVTGASNPNGGTTGTGVGFGGNSGIAGLSSSGSLSINGVNLSGDIFGSGGFNSSLFNAGVNSAVSNLKKYRENQKKNADAFKKKVGDSERGKRLIAKAAEFRNNFYGDSDGGGSSTLTASKAGNLSGRLGAFGSTELDANGANGKDGAGAGGSQSANSVGVKGGGAGGSANKLGGSTGDDGLGGLGDYGNESYADGSSGSANGSGGSSLSPEDTKRISDAIKSRDGNSDKYSRQDGMTLWEIVTNTYIRVYDRLLERKNNDLE